MCHGISKTAVVATATAANHTVRQLFRVAWQAKHGSEPSDGQLKNDLRRFDRRNFVPPYVRNLLDHKGDYLQFAARVH